MRKHKCLSDTLHCHDPGPRALRTEPLRRRSGLSHMRSARASRGTSDRKDKPLKGLPLRRWLPFFLSVTFGEGCCVLAANGPSSLKQPEPKCGVAASCDNPRSPYKPEALWLVPGTSTPPSGRNAAGRPRSNAARQPPFPPCLVHHLPESADSKDVPRHLLGGRSKLDGPLRASVEF